MSTQSVRGAQVKVFKNLPPAVGDYYRQWFKEYGDKKWITYDTEKYTFNDANLIMDSLAAELVASFGVQKGDRVGIAMRNLPEFMLGFLGVTAMGAIVVPLNSLWNAEELAYAIKDSGSTVLIVDAPRMKLCESLAKELGIKLILARGTSEELQASGAAAWDDVIAAGKGKPAPSTKGIQAEDDCMIMYTSGSTGFPKGVCHTQRSVGTGTKLGELSGKIIPEPNQKQLFAVPLFHITAIAPIFLWSIPQGGELIMMRKWDAGEALKVIEAEKVTRFTGVPTMIRDMLEHPTFTAKQVASVKNMAAGGAPVPPSQVAQMRKKAKGVAPTQGYGLTETMAFATANRGVDYLTHPTSCGRPIPLLIEIKIKDPETNKAVPDGERGEVCIKSAMLMRCYWNRPDDTKKVLDEEGFFHSGDVGKMEGGFVYILDRLKDLIIRGGENIDCSEVEAAIYSHPAVRECSVFGLPDERLGEVVGAAVWCTGDVQAAELSAHAAKHLSKFKIPEPKNIFLLKQELPKGATGKIDKKGLRDTYKDHIAPPQSKL